MPWFTGVERESISWSPTIDASKCIQCGMCMNCGKGVFAWSEDLRPHVVKPLDCVVGCTTCANLCPGKAIHFPDLSELRRYYAKNKIWNLVRKEMVKNDKIRLKTEHVEELIDATI